MLNRQYIVLLFAVMIIINAQVDAKTIHINAKHSHYDYLIEKVIPEIEEIVPKEQKELLCMSIAILREADAVNQEDQRAVGNVIMSRLEDGRWGNTVCAIVFGGDFSFVRERGRKAVIKDDVRWEHIQQIAWNVFFAEDGPTNSRTHFYNPNLRRALGLPAEPKWAKWGFDKKRIGQHVYMEVAEKID